jgi:hypothetical protein
MKTMMAFIGIPEAVLILSVMLVMAVVLGGIIFLVVWLSCHNGK